MVWGSFSVNGLGELVLLPKYFLAKMVHSQEDHAFLAVSIGAPAWGVQYFWLVYCMSSISFFLSLILINFSLHSHGRHAFNFDVKNKSYQFSAVVEMSCFLARAEPPLPRWQALAFPFQWNTWVAILLGLVGSGPLLHHLAARENTR